MSRLAAMLGIVGLLAAPSVGVAEPTQPDPPAEDTDTQPVVMASLLPAVLAPQYRYEPFTAEPKDEPRQERTPQDPPRAQRPRYIPIGVIAIAKSYIGVPYLWGGETPDGWDCSGFTQYVFAKTGRHIPRTAEDQRRASNRNIHPLPGDLIFFGIPAYHVGIYLGRNLMIDARKPGTVTQVRPVFAATTSYGRF